MPSRRSPWRWRPVTDTNRSEPALARRLGVGDAAVIGVGSMVGAGVFAVWAPAAKAAGALLLVSLVVAAVVAYCNAVSSAQLAAVYPVSGGTYAYGRERLGPWWGYLAGSAFVLGKTASCAAMALTFATYAVPDHRLTQRLVALAAVIALAAVNYRGITRTAALTRIIVACTLVVLTTVVVILLSSPATVPVSLHRHQPVRRTPGCGSALLRLRGLCADRHHGRGGPRTGANHPASDPDRACSLRSASIW